MLVTIISPDLSSNCLGRAYVLAQLVERNHDVEIVGPKLAGTIWEPVQNEYDYKTVDTGSRIYQFPLAIGDILDCISGDIIYASKPRATSYGVSLLAALRYKRPIILDIDDWESGFSYKNGQIKTLLGGIPNLISVDSYYYGRSLEALSGCADVITISNSFLENRFGGALIPHAKDTNKLDPSKFDKQAARKEFGLPVDDFLVMFSGTPRPHKGVDDLARAVTAIDQEDVRAVIVGAHESAYVDKVRRLGGDSVIIRGIQPFDEIPRWLAAADAVAIPQRDSPATWGQMPSKVFDAMAMGKPVIASDVSDLSKVLSGCGLIIEPGNIRSLQESITRLYQNQNLCDKLGKKARYRCVQQYSYDSLAPQINKIICDIAK